MFLTGPEADTSGAIQDLFYKISSLTHHLPFPGQTRHFKPDLPSNRPAPTVLWNGILSLRNRECSRAVNLPHLQPLGEGNCVIRLQVPRRE